MRYPDSGGLAAPVRAKREQARRRAADWFAEGVPAAEVARRLRVSKTAAYGWRQGGVEALTSKGSPGSRCRLDEPQLHELGQVLDEGPAAHGFTEDQRWTLARVADLIARRFRIRYTLRGAANVMYRLGWSVQVPKHRAVERDKQAIVTWRKETWPAGKR
jgi:transposase